MATQRVQKPPRLWGTPIEKAWYGNAQEHYNVQVGDVWGAEGGAGGHRFICGDVMTLYREGRLQQYIPECQVIHTDPPWTAAIYKRFYYWADIEHWIPFDDFIHTLVQINKTFCPNGLILTCAGYRLSKALPKIYERYGAKTLQMIEATYTERHVKYWEWVGTFGNATVPPNLLDYGKHDDEIIRSVSYATAGPGINFLDPLCGEMTFLGPSAEKGSTVFGVELIPRKFAEGLRNMVKHIGEPKLLDRM